MGVATRILGLSVVAAYLLPRYVPQYPLGSITTGVLLLILNFTFYAFYAVVLYPRFFSPIRHVPEPPGRHFFTGHTKRILAEPSGVPMQDWVGSVPNPGIIRYSMWFKERLLVTTPAALSEVLVTKNYDFVKPWALRTGLGVILGVGILLAEGDEHRKQRKLLMPAFAFRHVKNIYPVFWNKSRELMECLSAAARTDESTSGEHVSAGDEKFTTVPKHEKGAVDVGEWVSRATLDIIGLSGMGQDFNALQNPDNKLANTYKTVFTPGRSARLIQVAGVFLPSWLVSRLPLKRNHEIRAASSHIKQVCRDLIALKREAIASKKGRVEVDILSVALESGGFTDEELVAQMMTFIVAGHETTATAMLWAIYLLCKHPSIQTKLRAEIRARIPSLSNDITAADIDDCHYLQAVCNEVLRLWAPVGLTIRVADRDTSISGTFVPKGTPVIMSPWAINRSTALWGPDALAFNPDRWLSADGTKCNSQGGADSNYSFLTFLHGPRSCIGQKFAQGEFACILAAWIGRFETRFEEGSPLAEDRLPDVQGGVTAKPKGGVWCRLTEVEGW